MGRIVLIGDIQGCIDEFRSLIDAVRPDSYDKVILLGDLLDRGPDGAACVRFARDNGFLSVVGNHDDKHWRWRKHQQRVEMGLQPDNPVRLSDAQRADNDRMSDDDIEWIGSLPPMIQFAPGYLAVHGGFLPTRRKPWQEQKRAEMMRVRWVKEDTGGFCAIGEDKYEQPQGCVYWTTVWDAPENVVYGHNVLSLDRPTIDYGRNRPGVPAGSGDCYSLDTGCCFGGHLTAMILEAGREPYFMQAKALRTYSPRHRD